MSPVDILRTARWVGLSCPSGHSGDHANAVPKLFELCDWTELVELSGLVNLTELTELAEWVKISELAETSGSTEFSELTELSVC